MTSELTWRPFGPDDLDELFGLISRVQDHDRENERTTRHDLDVAAARPWIDLSTDSLMAVDDSGVPRAWGRTGFRPGESTSLTVQLLGGVDPDWRGLGLGRRILAWEAERAMVIAETLRDDASVPVQVGGFVENHLDDRRRLFEAGGFVASRYFNELRQTIPSPLVDLAPLPAPLELVPFDESNSDRVRIALNISFADHWGYAAIDPDRWAVEAATPTFRPALSAAIVDRSTPGEPVVAFVLNSEYEEDWDDPAKKEGYVEYLGVIPEWRSHGLASYLLNLTAARFAGVGHTHVALGVDTENVTGAMRLYESLGYEQVHGTTYYSTTV